LDRAKSVGDFLASHWYRIAKGEMRIGGMGKKGQVGNIDSLNRRTEVVFCYESESIQTAEKVLPKDVDTVFSLNNIYFVENSPVLTGSSILALPSIVRELGKYKSRTMMIMGNCNSNSPILKDNDPLFKLSVERAKVIYELLVEAGFNPGKMSYEGLGNSKPRNSDPTTPEQMRANMRVEIAIYK
jgi:outer membrane protein OmpA-like peptidoglycan-associated protein